MSKKATTTKELNKFVIDLQERLQKSEALTSHVFVSYLYELTSVKSYQLIPQTTLSSESKRGQIDYAYMSPSHSGLNFFIELKPYKKIKSSSLKEKQILTYLNKAFPLELLTLKRKDMWRVGIFTDLATTVVYLKKKEKGSTTKPYSLPIIRTKLLSVESLFKKLDILFGLELGELTKQIVWDDSKNRYEIVFTELSQKKGELFNLIYKQKWLKARKA